MHFSTVVDRYDFDAYHYTVAYLPPDATVHLPLETHPRLRVEATVDGVLVIGALMPDRVGSNQTSHLLETRPEGERVWYLMIPKRVLKRLKKTLGDPLEVAVRPGDQDAVDEPKALSDALEANPRLRDLWDALTPGKRRTLAHPIRAARTEATRQKRLEALEVTLLEG